jgi:superfamily II DNA or RNA helicase
MERAWWPAGREPVQVLSTEQLWGADVAVVLVPSTGRVERLAADELVDLTQRRWTEPELSWRAARGLIMRSVAGGDPLAVAAGGIDPLPHQLAVLDRAMHADPVRLLFADEVGLGKTIEAGLVISELKARGEIHRVLVVAPKGVQLQWVAEMAEKFGEQFVLVGRGGVPVDAGIDPWRTFDQVVCSLDAVKPLRSRAGWSPERLARHNERRSRALIESGWDLVVIDEAHHVAGSSEDVARHQLGRKLAMSSPRLLLLSATPHSGKSEAFARLLGLLDEGFVHGRPINRQTVASLVVRTEKRHATDAGGRPLFWPRTTELVTIPYGPRKIERRLYEAVTDYVRHGYARAKAERRPVVGFLVLLMQRLVSSSTEAILTALERRLAAVTSEGEQLRLFGERMAEWRDLTGEEQLAALSDAQGEAWGNERGEVELLVDLARKARSAGLDAKARHLLDLLGSIARRDGDPGAKVVVFTEFIPTQTMLLELLDGAGISSVAINGSMSIEERRQAQQAFRDDVRILVSTDAGGEGVNLQFAHVVVNYDLPWSPTRIEQRIGRVDRIGQTSDVTAYNLVLESSIDARVIEVLQAKLAVILAELGADKEGDILATTDQAVENLYAAAIVDPGSIDRAAEEFADGTRATIREMAPLRDALGDSHTAAPLAHRSPLPRWIELADRASTALGQQPGRTALPDVMPGEPAPQIAGATTGWWSWWETSGGSTREAFALFVSDSRAIRPDLAERIWVQLAEGVDPITGPVLSDDVFHHLRNLAVDHGYRHPTSMPSLTPRLIVRVES